MTWAKVDDQFFQHPKALAAGPMACLLYIGGLTYCNRFLTDGHIPAPAVRSLVPNLAHTSRLSARLVDVGLWTRGVDGFSVVNFGSWNERAEDVKADRDARRAMNRERQRRWRKAHANKDNAADGNGASNALQTPLQIPSPAGADVTLSRPRNGPPTPTPTPTPTRVTTESTPTPAAIAAEATVRSDIEAGILSSNGHGAPRKRRPKEDDPPGFAEVWAAYPNHDGSRSLAVDCFRARPADVTVEVILASIAQWKQSDRWRRGFIPYLERWLKEKRWQAEPRPASGLSPKTTGNAEVVRRFAHGLQGEQA